MKKTRRQKAIFCFSRKFNSKTYAKKLENVVFKECANALEYAQAVRRILFNATAKESPSTLLLRTTAEWLTLNNARLHELLKESEEKKIKSLALNLACVSTANSLIRCKFCKEHSVNYTQKQTRSADEPMTLFYACSACDRRWRG